MFEIKFVITMRTLVTNSSAKSFLFFVQNLVLLKNIRE